MMTLKLPGGIRRKLALLLLGVALVPLGIFGFLAYVNGRASLEQKVSGALEERMTFQNGRRAPDVPVSSTAVPTPMSVWSKVRKFYFV